MTALEIFVVYVATPAAPGVGRGLEVGLEQVAKAGRCGCDRAAAEAGTTAKVLLTC